LIINGIRKEPKFVIFMLKKGIEQKYEQANRRY